MLCILCRGKGTQPGGRSDHGSLQRSAASERSKAVVSLAPGRSAAPPMSGTAAPRTPLQSAKELPRPGFCIAFPPPEFRCPAETRPDMTSSARAKKAIAGNASVLVASSRAGEWLSSKELGNFHCTMSAECGLCGKRNEIQHCPHFTRMRWLEGSVECGCVAAFGTLVHFLEYRLAPGHAAAATSRPRQPR